MVNFNYAKQLEFWKQTNYSAQMEEMKKAGLNPALIYGSSGSGGTTGSPSGGVAGASAPSGGGEALAFMGIAQQQQQLKLLQAQEENIKANTNKTNIEAGNIGTGGIDTKVKESQLGLMAEQTKNETAKNLLIKADTFSKNLQNYITSETADFTIDKAYWEAQMAYQNLLKAANETYISNETIDQQVGLIKQNLTAAILDNHIRELNKKQIKANIANTKADTNLKNVGYIKTEQEIRKLTSDIFLTDAKTKETLNNIALNWANYNIAEKRLQVETIMNKLQSIYAHEDIGPIESQSHDVNQVIEELDKIYKTENFSLRPNWKNYKIPL